MIRLALITLAIVAGSGLSATHADELSGSSLITTPPPPGQLANILFPELLQTDLSSVKTRAVDERGVAGIRVGKNKLNTRSESTGGGAKASSANMAIRFGFGSTIIQKESHAMVESIARMLQMDGMEDTAIYIEGHTDSIGEPKENKRLSLLRAVSVKNYLVNIHGIDANRLHVNGKGESSPLIADRPEAAENRRVEIKPL